MSLPVIAGALAIVGALTALIDGSDGQTISGEAAGASDSRPLGLDCADDEMIVAASFTYGERAIGGPVTPEDAIATALDRQFVGVDLADTEVRTRTDRHANYWIMDGGARGAVIEADWNRDHWTITGIQACSGFAHRSIRHFADNGGGQ